jgi:hypothetical protein
MTLFLAKKTFVVVKKAAKRKEQNLKYVCLQLL